MTNNACNTDKPLQVVRGGTGQASLAAYSTLTAGATSTAAIVPTAPGDAGRIFISGGPAATSIFRRVGMKLVSTQNLVAATSATWTSLSGNYGLIIDNVVITGAPADITLSLQISDDNGLTWKNTDYKSGQYATAWNGIFSFNDANSSTTQFLLQQARATATTFQISGSYTLGQFGSSTNFMTMNGLAWGLSQVALAGDLIFAGGTYEPAAPVTPNAIKVLINGGTMTGAISLYSM